MKLVVWAVLASLVIYASSSFSNASIPRETTLEITFPSRVELPLGTSVVLEGRRVGYLSEVSHEGDSYIVVLEEDSRLIREGAMAIVSSAWAAEMKQSLSFVELLNPAESLPLRSKGQLRIMGYADFESFWGSKENTHWVDAAPAAIS